MSGCLYVTEWNICELTKFVDVYMYVWQLFKLIKNNPHFGNGAEGSFERPSSPFVKGGCFESIWWAANRSTIYFNDHTYRFFIMRIYFQRYCLNLWIWFRGMIKHHDREVQFEFQLKLQHKNHFVTYSTCNFDSYSKDLHFFTNVYISISGTLWQFKLLFTFFYHGNVDDWLFIILNWIP